MDDLHKVFREKSYQAGFLLRRQYLDSTGKKSSKNEREWVRCYLELRGPILSCWRAGACNADAASITRLLQTARLKTDMEFPLIDLRSATLELLKDFSIDSTTHNCFSINYHAGMEKVQFMALNSTTCRNWTGAIESSTKEAYVIDQRYTALILNEPSQAVMIEGIFPDPPEVKILWPGGIDWIQAYIWVEGKKGLKHSGVRDKKSYKCIYIYSDLLRKSCLARLMRITSIYAMSGCDGQQDTFDFILEGAGKRKSSKLGGLEITTRAFFRVNSSSLRLHWISALRNTFEVFTSPTVLAITEADGSLGKITSPGSNSSDHSMVSNPSDPNRYANVVMDSGMVMPVRKPWEHRASIDGETGCAPSIRNRGRTCSNFNFDENYTMKGPMMMMEEERRRQYELHNSYTYNRQPQMNSFYNGYPMTMMANHIPPPFNLTMSPMYAPMPPLMNSFIPPYTITQEANLYYPSPPPQHHPSSWERAKVPSLRASISQHSFSERTRRRPRQDEIPAELFIDGATKRHFLSLIESAVEMRPNNILGPQQLYGRYEQHCRASGKVPASISEVGRWMDELGYKLVKESTQVGWQHVALKK